jgi:hypothetical protein
MVVAHVRIVPIGSISPGVLAKVRDVVQVWVGAAKDIEHVRVRAGPDGIAVLAFADGNDPDVTADMVRRLVTDAIEHDESRRLWRIL